MRTRKLTAAVCKLILSEHSKFTHNTMHDHWAHDIKILLLQMHEMHAYVLRMT